MSFVIGVGSFADVIIRSGGAVDWSVWVDHFWQARGAPDYATSLLDKVGSADLVEGNEEVPWDEVNGWGFVAAAAQYFDTGLIPANDQSWSVFVQYANATVDGLAVGSVEFGIGRITLRPLSGGGNVNYGNGNGEIVVAPQLATGNIGVAGAQGYRNGIAEGGALPAYGGVPTLSIAIGARNDLAPPPSLFITAGIRAVGIREGPPLTAPEVAALAAAMAAI